MLSVSDDPGCCFVMAWNLQSQDEETSQKNAKIGMDCAGLRSSSGFTSPDAVKIIFGVGI
jgi:hypothetical protein